MTTPLEKIAEEKTGNYQSSLKGGGGGYPILVKDQYISGFSFEGFPYQILEFDTLTSLKEQQV